MKLFGRPGAAVSRRCWCMYYRQPGVGESAKANREALRSLLRPAAVPGLVAYLDGSPAGWISLGPRDHFPKLQRSSVAKPIDDVPVWSIVCFFVESKLRGSGIAEHLLRAGVAYARSKGATFVEAYPVDKRGSVDNESAFVGTRPMFARAGIQEVARRRPTRPVMRKALRTGAEWDN